MINLNSLVLVVCTTESVVHVTEIFDSLVKMFSWFDLSQGTAVNVLESLFCFDV